VPVQTVVSLSRLAEFRLGWSTVDEWLGRLHCKKGYKFSHSQPGCLQTIPDREKLNYSLPGRVQLVTSRLGTGKSLTFFTVYTWELFAKVQNSEQKRKGPLYKIALPKRNLTTI
jgi:hypothetical protein